MTEIALGHSFAKLQVYLATASLSYPKFILVNLFYNRFLITLSRWPQEQD